MSEPRPRKERPPGLPISERLEGWGRRAAVGLLVLGLVLLVFFVGRAFLPRWWAHRIGGQVQGSIGAGITLGLSYGFIFTIVPLIVLWRGFRKRRHVRVWGGFVLAAVLLALPNLLTLGIVFGRGSAAHAGERTLDVEAPAYRTSALIGAIVAALLFAALYYLLFSRRLARGRTAKLRTRLKLAEQEVEAAPAAPPPPPEPPPPPA